MTTGALGRSMGPAQPVGVCSMRQCAGNAPRGKAHGRLGLRGSTRLFGMQHSTSLTQRSSDPCGRHKLQMCTAEHPNHGRSPVGLFSILLTISKPSSTSPNTVWRPSSLGWGRDHKKRGGLSQDAKAQWAGRAEQVWLQFLVPQLHKQATGAHAFEQLKSVPTRELTRW